MHNYTEKLAKRCQFFVLRVFDIGEGWLHPPQTPRKQVSHLHIVEGALPLTEIALQYSYPCSDFYLMFIVILMVYFF